MTKTNVTLSIDKKIYDRYVKLCKQKGWIKSKQFELLMIEQLK